jgi:hypothetical protein
MMETSMVCSLRSIGGKCSATPRAHITGAPATGTPHNYLGFLTFYPLSRRTHCTKVLEKIAYSISGSEMVIKRPPTLFKVPTASEPVSCSRPM